MAANIPPQRQPPNGELTIFEVTIRDNQNYPWIIGDSVVGCPVLRTTHKVDRLRMGVCVHVCQYIVCTVRALRFVSLTPSAAVYEQR